MRLIDADALLNDEITIDTVYGFAKVVESYDIINAPTVDAVPVRHGHWIYHDDGVFTCSECGNAESNDSYYCRLCGAKMNGLKR